ncbi:MAG: NADP-dependent isocitrate dehydrogenase [Bacteroidota bacterium]
MQADVLSPSLNGLAKDQLVKIAIAKGDGIGPEIMDAVLRILDAAGARIEPEFIELGEKAYLAGHSAGITRDAWDVIGRNRVILKAPITTPQGKGYKSLNVTLRKSLGLFANVRPVTALHPYVPTHFPAMDVVVIRENEEDLYAGIEHRQTQDVVQCLKLITRPGSEKIIRYAFEYARAHGRKKVTCMVKDNIMKLTDGLFHRVFKEIAAEYTDIESNSQIIDIGAARLAATPEQYDVIVTSNLYGDIVSDIVAETAGSVGMAGSANIGKDVAMFEAIHGSAPDIAGQNVANPSGLLNGAILMLYHIGQAEVANKIKNAWLATIEAGHHTQDIYVEGSEYCLVSTREFADAVIAHLGDVPQHLQAVEADLLPSKIELPDYKRQYEQKQLVGVDVFIDWPGSDPQQIGNDLSALQIARMKLKMITNRGVKVYPSGLPDTYCTDHWRCRFISTASTINGEGSKYAPITYDQVIALLAGLNEAEFDVIKTENLYEFDGNRGFSLGQGE